MKIKGQKTLLGFSKYPVTLANVTKKESKLEYTLVGRSQPGSPLMFSLALLTESLDGEGPPGDQQL